MAEPINFYGTNKRLNPAPGTEDAVKTLYVFGNGQENISCWKLSPEEAAEVARTGEVWLSVLSGQTCHPVFVSGTPLMIAFDQDTGEETVYHSNGQHVIDDARRFATLYHGDQKYGADLPYTYHLERVVQVLIDFGADHAYLTAAWLHDFVEDCLQDLPVAERRQMVASRFGTLVDALVWCCTGVMVVDGVKQNRKARNAQQYEKIKSFVHAAPLKCADRIANQEASAEQKYSGGGMYVDEVIGFDDNVGVWCPPEMRVRLLRSALAVADYTNPKPEVRAAIEERLVEVSSLLQAA